NNCSHSLLLRSGAADETSEIGRADHVEIDIDSDRSALIVRQRVDVVARADQATLLRAPECEAHAPAVLCRLLRQSQRRFEHGRRAAAVVIDPRSLGHAVEVRTNDDQWALVVAASVGHDVSSRTLAAHSVHRKTYDAAGPSRERAAELVRHT